MCHSPGPRRVLAVPLPCAAFPLVPGHAAAARDGSGEKQGESAKRYHAPRRGGVVRAAVPAISYRRVVTRTAAPGPARPCRPLGGPRPARGRRPVARR
ncbi:hypothetical protein FHS40_002973 [Streptomyces spectabilis]|uniref:Uncharacterized protein n=1 Tax=Streptomyces spectabilis TaxID=68270 RepID=A0A7W8ATX0_STRST|nr:hypothetical protein [Streptomyces spectabilis]